MKDWLAKLAEQTKSEDEVLHEQIQSLSPEVLQELAYDLDSSSRPSQLDAMAEKIADAERMGRELAHERGGELIKEAGILQMGLGALKGFATGGPGGAVLGAAKEGVKDAVSSGIKSTVARGVSSVARGPAAAPAAGGFSYGKVAALNLAGMGQKAVGFLGKNPGAALTLAGAGAGALMAPRDPQTGQKQYLRGALMGGGLAAGAHALSDGRLGNKALQMVTRENKPIFGQKARSFVNSSMSAAQPGSVGGAQAINELKQHAPPMSPEWQAAHAGVRDMQEHAQLRNQFQRPAMAAPTPAAQRVGGFSFRGPAEAGQPWANVKLASPAGLILRAALMDKLAAMGGAPALFSTKLSPTRAAGAVMGGGMKGLQTATKSVTPPPRPMARPAQGTGTFAAPAGPSPFAAAPRQAPAQAGGLASVQNQLNSAKSIAGGGPMMPSGGATIRAMPGSGW